MARRRPPKTNGYLEDLIRHGVALVLTCFTIAAEQAGDERARDVLKDKKFRQRFHALAREIAAESLARLGAKR